MAPAQISSDANVVLRACRAALRTVGPLSRRQALAVRLAAVIALIAVVFAGLIVLGVIVDNPDETVIAFLFLLFAMCMGWLAITRRGVVRFVAVPFFVLGLALLVLQLGLYGAEMLALLIAAVALYGFRTALAGKPLFGQEFLES